MMEKVISGFGQYHTNKPSSSKSKDFILIGLEEIRNLVDSPRKTSKQRAQWIIPSTLLSRSYEEQALNGNYQYLWADLDESPKPIEFVREVVEGLMGADFEIYTTSSATKDKPKSRILIPLANSLNFSDWNLYQGVLNKLLCQHQITPDEANKRAGQLCYLPNQGKYYESTSRRNNIYFDPQKLWRNFEHDTEEHIRLLKTTEITESTEVIVCFIDWFDVPKGCFPKEIGQRNRCIFEFARYLKALFPEYKAPQVRPLVQEWHSKALVHIGTVNFLDSWTEFVRGWDKVKFPYGARFDLALQKVDKHKSIPKTLQELGYDQQSFYLLMICKELQDKDGIFFISARTAAACLDCSHTTAARLLAAFVIDGFLELIEKGAIRGKINRASRYRYTSKTF